MGLMENIETGGTPVCVEAEEKTCGMPRMQSELIPHGHAHSALQHDRVGVDVEGGKI